MSRYFKTPKKLYCVAGFELPVDKIKQVELKQTGVETYVHKNCKCGFPCEVKSHSFNRPNIGSLFSQDSKPSQYLTFILATESKWEMDEWLQYRIPKGALEMLLEEPA